MTKVFPIIPEPNPSQKEALRKMKYNLESMLTAHAATTGWCSIEKSFHLYNLVLESNSQCSLELGCFYGKSFLPLAFAHAYKGSGTAIGTDAFNNIAPLEGNNDERNSQWWSEINFDQAYQFVIDSMSKYDLNHFTQIIKARSEDVANFFEDYSIDILHQDSNHSSEVILKELELFIPKLKPHGFWCCDDVNWSEAQDGYKKLPDYGLTLVKDFESWQIWQNK